jgi:hypothetical protein
VSNYINQLKEEWQRPSGAPAPVGEAAGAIYRPGVMEEPMFQGITAGNQSQYAKNPYMPSSWREYGRTNPQMVRDPDYPEPDDPRLQTGDMRRPLGGSASGSADFSNVKSGNTYSANTPSFDNLESGVTTTAKKTTPARYYGGVY